MKLACLQVCLTCFPSERLSRSSLQSVSSVSLESVSSCLFLLLDQSRSTPTSSGDADLKSSAGVSYDNLRAKTCTLEGPCQPKHHQNSTRRSPEREKKTREDPERKKKENGSGRAEKARNVGLPAFGPHLFFWVWVPTLRLPPPFAPPPSPTPHPSTAPPSDPPPFRPPLFQGCAPTTSDPAPSGPRPCPSLLFSSLPLLSLENAKN